MLNLKPPRHTPTLRIAVVRCVVFAWLKSPQGGRPPLDHDLWSRGRTRSLLPTPRTWRIRLPCPCASWSEAGASCGRIREAGRNRQAWSRHRSCRRRGVRAAVYLLSLGFADSPIGNIAGRHEPTPGAGKLKSSPSVQPVKATLLTEVEPRAGVAPDHFRPKFAFRHFEKRFAGTMQRHEIIGANLFQG